MTAIADPSQAQAVTVAAYPKARFDAGVRIAGTVFLWASLVLVGFWWASDGGIQDLFNTETVLNSLGRITGLVASDLLLFQVLLMARIPVFERAFGRDRMMRMHRFVGLRRSS